MDQWNYRKPEEILEEEEGILCQDSHISMLSNFQIG